MKWLEVAIS